MEKRERLEQFIRDNRKEFDEFEPSSDLWSRIEKGLDQAEKKQPKRDKVVKLKIVLRIAAMFLMFCTFGILYIRHQMKAPIDIASIDPELAKQQSHYVSVIEFKREELVQIRNQEPELYQEFSAELEKLQTNYKKLQKDLKTSPNQEVTLKAMIKNLQVQAQVLNQQLSIIEQLKQLRGTQDNENKGI
ncbi:hypothetical protein [Desertivirga brevis]|uniref:hypothetical protein n=1 Tax=Desertivirga brevis TaxID=2810310 RepID=UPI001A971899|nr:hypothetical protein [Pedobacter sp. SYSU D00873]